MTVGVVKIIGALLSFFSFAVCLVLSVQKNKFKTEWYQFLFFYFYWPILIIKKVGISVKLKLSNDVREMKWLTHVVLSAGHISSRASPPRNRLPDGRAWQSVREGPEGILGDHISLSTAMPAHLFLIFQHCSLVKFEIFILVTFHFRWALCNADLNADSASRGWRFRMKVVK